MKQEELTELYEDALGLLKQLIATPSYSREEDETASLLATYLEGKGLVAHRHLNNVWAINKYFDDTKPTILLNSHHDTVKPGAKYTNNPFEAIEQNGKLYGLGSNDAGGCLVALLAAFLYFCERGDLRYNLIFVATAEEEISGANGIAALLPILGRVDCAIVGEPTEMNMAIAEKGLMVLDCVVHGRSGHAADYDGENAIYKAMRDIEWFQNYSFPKTSDLLGPVKMSVTVINAGKQHNVIPDTCSFTVDCRINECYSHEEIFGIIKQHVQCELTPRSMRLRSTSIALNHPLVVAGKKSGRTIYGSPTLSDKALMPFPALKMGPGLSARSHMTDEFIFVDEIREGVALYIQLLKEIL
jgi:acetylornithine deacetylase